jgi:hypothetical protein
MKTKRGPTLRQTADSTSSAKPGGFADVDRPGVPTQGSLADETEMFADLACDIRRMQYPKLPPDFVGSVLRAVELRKMPWWYRLYRWGKASHSITVRPFQVLPAAAMVLVMLIAGFHVLKGGSQQIALNQPANGIPVTLSLVLPEARSVQVVGSFNGWRPRRAEMHRDENGAWRAVLQLPAGRYEYAFLVDGARIVHDPHAEFHQDDCFGNRNNILVVGHSYDAAI